MSDLLVVAVQFLAKRRSFSTTSELERPTLSLKSTGTNKWQKRQTSKHFGFICKLLRPHLWRHYYYYYYYY
eukprot:8793395-Heterocapsa_arctica.AAC.1